jgi:hypothetical protein
MAREPPGSRPQISSWKFGIFAFSLDMPILNPTKKAVATSVIVKSAFRNSFIVQSLTLKCLFCPNDMKKSTAGGRRRWIFGGVVITWMMRENMKTKTLALILATMVFAAASWAQGTRPPVQAGGFYDADPGRLGAQIDA